MDEKQPSRRLITQNLLTSASLFEHRDSITWRSVQDLAAFIDIFCLYDRGVVLGRNVTAQLYNWKSDLLGLMKNANFIIIEYPNEITDKVTKVARRHLVSFLGEQETSKYDTLLNEVLTPERTQYLLLQIPDSEHEIEIGREWLLTTPSYNDLLDQLIKEGSVARSATFLIRSFVYLAYADVSKLAFTPDAVRCPVLDSVISKEEQFRGRLRDALNEPWTDGVGDKELLERISPFAAIVFARAGKNKKRIVPEIERLRLELENDRRHLLALEDKILWGTYIERLEAIEKYNQVVSEIASSFSVTHPLKVTTKFILDMSGDIGEVLDSPEKLSAWAKIIKLPDHAIKRFTARGTTAGIHRLMQDRNIPAPEKMRSSIYHLFGPIQG